MPPSTRLAATAHSVLDRRGGVTHLQGLLEAGLTRENVGHLRHLGVLLRPRIGWYADPKLPEAAIRALRVGGLLGCTSAAAALGMVVPERSDRLLQVSLVPGSTRLRRSTDPSRRAWAGTEAGVRWHWERRVAPTGAWSVSPVDALLQMAACVDPRWLIAAIDSARCRAQRPALLSARDLALLRTSLPAHLRVAVDRSDAGCETAGETFVRLELEDRRIPYSTQHRITTAYRADGLVDDWLPVDIDGLATHGTPEAVERDHERDNVIALHTVPPLRFMERKAVHDTGDVADVIEAVWRRGRPSGLR